MPSPKTLFKLLLLPFLLTHCFPPIQYNLCSGIQTGQITPILDITPFTDTSVPLTSSYPNNLYKKWIGIIGLGYSTPLPSFDTQFLMTTPTSFILRVLTYQNGSMTYRWEFRMQYLVADGGFSWMRMESDIVKHSGNTTVGANPRWEAWSNPGASVSVFCSVMIRGLRINSTEVGFSVRTTILTCNTMLNVSILYSNSNEITATLTILIVDNRNIAYQRNVRSYHGYLNQANRASISTWDMSYYHLLIGLSDITGFQSALSQYSMLYNSILLLNELQNPIYPYTLNYAFLTNLTCPVNTVNRSAQDCICLQGFYEVTSTCQPCVLYCTQCSNLTVCEVCNNTRVPSTNCTTCVGGWYDAGIPACQKCLVTCLTCVNSTTCLSCNDTNKNSTNYCMCKDGWWWNKTSGMCNSCRVGCLTCLDYDTCLECRHVTRNISTKICECDIGYYQWWGNAQCYKCGYRCYTCTSGTSCTKCAHGLQRDLNTSGACVCKNGFYDDGSNLDCKVCLITCLTCNGGGLTNCLTCNVTQNRQISSSRCVCRAGTFQNSSDICPLCPYFCVTCTNMTNCLSCPSGNFRNINPLCTCLTRYYDNNITLCSKCNYTCLTCTNLTACTSCSPLLDFRNSSTLPHCDCNIGYFDNNLTVCEKCPSECISCVALDNCTRCTDWYVLKRGKCIPQVVTRFWLEFVKLEMNQVMMRMRFNSSVQFNESVESVMGLVMGDKTYKMRVQVVSGTLLFIWVNITDFEPYVNCTFSPNTVNDTNQLPMYPQYTATLVLLDVPFYSRTDVGFMSFLQTLFSGLNRILTGCRFAAALVGCSFLLISLVQYANLVTLYLFLDMVLPHNLRTTLIAMYNSFDFKIIPFAVQAPGVPGATFRTPKHYHDLVYPFSYNLDLLGNMLTLITHLLILLSFYLFLFYLKRFLRWDNWFTRLLKIRFGPYLYSNCIMVYLMFHVWFAFAAGSQFLDNNYSSQYRVMQFGIAVMWMFFSIMVVFAHPAFLGLQKEEVDEVKTGECYWEVKRLQKLSEVFVMNRLLVPTTMALTIPLLPPLISLITVLVLLIARLCAMFFFKFRSFRHTFHYIATSTLHLFLHLMIIGFYASKNSLEKMSCMAWSSFGFVAVVLIALILLLELVHLFFELVAMVQLIVRKYLRVDNNAQVVEKKYKKKKSRGNKRKKSQKNKQSPDNRSVRSNKSRGTTKHKTKQKTQVDFNPPAWVNDTKIKFNCFEEMQKQNSPRSPKKIKLSVPKSQQNLAVNPTIQQSQTNSQRNSIEMGSNFLWFPPETKQPYHRVIPMSMKQCVSKFQDNLRRY